MGITTRSAYNALKIFVLDPKISGWLKANDPKSLEQAIRAVELIEEKETKEVRRRKQVHKEG